MAEDKIVKIKIVIEADTAQAEKATDQLIQKTADSSREFGIQDTKLGGMWKTFTSGGQMAVKTMSTLKGAIIATGIGALVILVAGLVSWFKRTETGSDLMAQGMKSLGQIVKDGPIVVFNALKTVISALLLPIKTIISFWKEASEVLSGKQGVKQAYADFTDTLKENTKDVVDNAKAVVASTVALVTNAKKAWDLEAVMDAIDDDRRKSLKKTKELEFQIVEAREKAFDIESSRAERLEAYQTILDKTNEKSAIELGLLQREFDAKKQALALDKDNLQMKLDVEAAENALIDAQKAAISERLRTQRMMNNLEKQDAADKRKQAEEALKLAEETAKALKVINDKKIADTKKLKDEIAILQQEGQYQEAIALQQKYDAELILIGENEEAKNLLWEKYRLLNLDLKEKYDLEEADKRKAKDDKEKADAKALEDAKKDIRLQALDNIASIGQSLQMLAGKNKKLALAGLFIEKAAAIGSIITQIALANAKMVAAFPVTGGLPWTAINTVAGALSIASVIKGAADAASQISNTPIEKKALGGYLGGASHQNGGITVNGEGGEFMVNKRTMSNPQMAAVIQSMNMAGNGGMGGGSMLTEARVIELAAMVVKAIPVYNVESESQALHRKVEQRESKYVQ